MTIPEPPLPSISLLLRALTASGFTGERWVDGREGYVARVYSRGSFALAAGVQAVRKATGAENITVWIPGYFCNEALEPLRAFRFALRFYPIKEDLSPDWPVLEKWVTRESEPQVLVLVHYFGFPNAIGEAGVFCKKHRMVLFEDAAHVLLPGSTIGQGDLLVFSPRKLLALPSGGILVTPNELATDLVVARGRGIRGETLHWLLRRLAQRVFTGLRIPWHFVWTLRRRAFRLGMNNSSTSELQLSCDSYTLRLLTVMASEVHQVIEQRRYNYQRLLERTSKLVQAHPLFPFLSDSVCPYVFPLLVDRGSEDVVATLQAWGIPASRWPDLPPEVLTSTGEHKVAMRIYEQLLLLPVHQSLSTKQLEMVGRRVCEALSRRS